MEKYHGNFQDDAGNAMEGALCYVYDEGTTDLADIYSDQAFTPESNPFTLLSEGDIDFYAIDENYDIKCTKSGYSDKWLYDIQFLDRAGVYAMIDGSTDGIKYYWASIAARNAQTGMATDELGMMTNTAQNDTDDEVGKVYQYSGAAWVYIYTKEIEGSNLDPVLKSESNELVFGNITNTTIDLDAKRMSVVNASNIPKWLDDVDMTFDIEADLMAGTTEKNSHDYGLWTDEDETPLMVPDLTGAADGTTAGYLVDSTNTYATDLVKAGDEVFNASTLVQTTVATTPTVDGNDLDVTDDIFVSGNNYKIVLLSPTGLGSYPTRFGSVFNNSSGNLDDSKKKGQARRTSAFWTTVNGFGSSSTKIQKFSAEVDASDDVVATIENSATLGFTITPNMDCDLFISYSGHPDAATSLGISKNSTQLTSNVATIQNSTRVAILAVAAANLSTTIHWANSVVKGDVLRPHTTGASDGTSPGRGTITVLAIEII